MDVDIPGHAFVGTGNIGQGWDLDRDKCQVYDVRQAPDERGKVHVVINLDCRPQGNVHVWGTLDAHCDLSR